MGARLLPFVDDFTLFAKSVATAMELKFERGLFVAPKLKLDSLAALAKQLLVKAAQNKRWVPVKGTRVTCRQDLVPSPRYTGGKILPPRAARHRQVRCLVVWHSKDLKAVKTRPRVVESVPKKHNGSPIFKAVETAYLHCDSNSFD